MWLNAVMVVIVVLVLIYLFQMTKAIYEEIQADANLQSRISISIRGEEERKLGQAEDENFIDENDAEQAGEDQETGIRE